MKTEKLNSKHFGSFDVDSLGDGSARSAMEFGKEYAVTIIGGSAVTFKTEDTDRTTNIIYLKDVTNPATEYALGVNCLINTGFFGRGDKQTILNNLDSSVDNNTKFSIVLEEAYSKRTGIPYKKAVKFETIK